MVEAVLRLDGCDVIPFGTPRCRFRNIKPAVSHQGRLCRAGLRNGFPLLPMRLSPWQGCGRCCRRTFIWAGGSLECASPQSSTGSLRISRRSLRCSCCLARATRLLIRNHLTCSSDSIFAPGHVKRGACLKPSANFLRWCRVQQNEPVRRSCSLVSATQPRVQLVCWCCQQATVTQTVDADIAAQRGC